MATDSRPSLVIYEEENEGSSTADTESVTYSLSVGKTSHKVILRVRTQFVDHRKENSREDLSDRYGIDTMKLIEWIRKNGESVTAR